MSAIYVSTRRLPFPRDARLLGVHNYSQDAACLPVIHSLCVRLLGVRRSCDALSFDVRHSTCACFGILLGVRYSLCDVRLPGVRHSPCDACLFRYVILLC